MFWWNIPPNPDWMRPNSTAEHQRSTHNKDNIQKRKEKTNDETSRESDPFLIVHKQIQIGRTGNPSTAATLRSICIGSVCRCAGAIQSIAEHSNTPQCSSDKATRVGSAIITINHKRNTRRYTVDHTNTTNATVTTASPGRQHVCFGPTREDNWR